MGLLFNGVLGHQSQELVSNHACDSLTGSTADTCIPK